ncbi:MipA/OmpV family protein [Thalassotalea sp. LPB0316]|uniref:MipA/OmpV family protein n=1 Tax=Thalassotalea sp. LPB0316 TaxID=2769490 RepID=UPI001865F303|nr:MipA/OmpV family protein [Thalassotalea sp. LPB0316]QOL25388.1 MipA/OmpV family protein [Thalassotalea sp. LPB0316]
MLLGKVILPSILSLCFAIPLIASANAATQEANSQLDERGENRAQLEPKGFLYGFGLGLSGEIYQGYDRRVIPLPVLGYRGDNFEILGPFASYDIYTASDIDFKFKLAPRFQGFDDGDSDVFIGMDERDFSMDAGLGVGYERNNWQVDVSAMFDVLGKSKGQEISAKVGKIFRQGPIFIEPNVQVSYLDDKHVDYYYGVRAHEVSETRGFYQGKSAVNYSVGLSVSTPILFDGFTMLALDYTLYDDTITNSPIVDQDTNLNLRLLYSAFF